MKTANKQVEILGIKFNITERGYRTDLVQFEVQGKTFEVQIVEDYEHAKKPWKFRRNTGRAYVNDAVCSEFPNEGDDKQIKRWQRELVKSQTEVLTAAFQALDLDVAFRWSRTAGCSCGCSAGFILHSRVAGWMDVWVNEVKVEKVLPSRYNLQDEE